MKKRLKKNFYQLFRRRRLRYSSVYARIIETQRQESPTVQASR
jgi:hypothetical protein